MLKFEFPHLIKALALAGGLAIIVIPITIALAQVCSEVLEKLSLNSEPQTLVKMIQEKKVYSIWQKHVFIFTVLIIAPIIEETVFRGIIYSTIKQMGFPKLALFGTSFLFAIVHGNLMILIPLTFLAITLSWLYELTDNLIAPIFMHALFNGVNLYFLMNNSS
jgi:membrane protease YdiL (CAAX protease family)